MGGYMLKFAEVVFAEHQNGAPQLVLRTLSFTPLKINGDPRLAQINTILHSIQQLSPAITSLQRKYRRDSSVMVALRGCYGQYDNRRILRNSLQECVNHELI